MSQELNDIEIEIQSIYEKATNGNVTEADLERLMELEVELNKQIINLFKNS